MQRAARQEEGVGTQTSGLAMWDGFGFLHKDGIVSPVGGEEVPKFLQEGVVVKTEVPASRSPVVVCLASSFCLLSLPILCPFHPTHNFFCLLAQNA